jgi:hypothetical protein
MRRGQAQNRVSASTLAIRRLTVQPGRICACAIKCLDEAVLAIDVITYGRHNHSGSRVALTPCA